MWTCTLESSRSKQPQFSMCIKKTHKYVRSHDFYLRYTAMYTHAFGKTQCMWKAAFLSIFSFFFLPSLFGCVFGENEMRFRCGELYSRCRQTLGAVCACTNLKMDCDRTPYGGSIAELTTSLSTYTHLPYSAIIPFDITKSHTTQQNSVIHGGSVVSASKPHLKSARTREWRTLATIESDRESDHFGKTSIRLANRQLVKAIWRDKTHISGTHSFFSVVVLSVFFLGRVHGVNNKIHSVDFILFEFGIYFKQHNHCQENSAENVWEVSVIWLFSDKKSDFEESKTLNHCVNQSGTHFYQTQNIDWLKVKIVKIHCCVSEQWWHFFADTKLSLHYNSLFTTQKSVHINRFR